MTLRITRQIVEVLGDPPFDGSLFATSELTLGQTVGLGMIKNLSATSALVLGQTANEQSVINVAAESVLQKTQIEFDPETLEPVEVITGLNQSADLNKTVGLSVSHVLSLSQDVIGSLQLAGAIALDATSALTLDHTAYISETPESGSVLTITHSADALVSKPVTSALVLDHSASVSGVWNRSAESELELGQSVAFVLIPAAGVDLCNYRPFVGGGPIPATLQGPYPGVTSPFALIYPATGAATDTVELRPPNLGNKDRLSFQRISRETRGGTLVVFADPIWPKIQTLVLNFSGLKRTEADELLRFMKDYLGQEIRLSDWEQRVWRGIITSPDDPIIQDGKDRFAASFTFEGELTTP